MQHVNIVEPPDNILEILQDVEQALMDLQQRWGVKNPFLFQATMSASGDIYVYKMYDDVPWWNWVEGSVRYCTDPDSSEYPPPIIDLVMNNFAVLNPHEDWHNHTFLNDADKWVESMVDKHRVNS